jgi:hypothetical protein
MQAEKLVDVKVDRTLAFARALIVSFSFVASSLKALEGSLSVAAQKLHMHVTHLVDFHLFDEGPELAECVDFQILHEVLEHGPAGPLHLLMLLRAAVPDRSN